MHVYQRDLVIDWMLQGRHRRGEGDSRIKGDAKLMPRFLFGAVG